MAGNGLGLSQHLERLSAAERDHLKALVPQDGAVIGRINLDIALEGGQMIPLQDGTPAPPPSIKRKRRRA